MFGFSSAKKYQLGEKMSNPLLIRSPDSGHLPFFFFSCIRTYGNCALGLSLVNERKGESRGWEGGFAFVTPRGNEHTSFSQLFDGVLVLVVACIENIFPVTIEVGLSQQRYASRVPVTVSRVFAYRRLPLPLALSLSISRAFRIFRAPISMYRTAGGP